MRNTEIIITDKSIDSLFNNLSNNFFTKLNYKFINDYQLTLANVSFEIKSNKTVSSVDIRSVNIYTLNKKALSLIRKYAESDPLYFKNKTKNHKFNSVNVNKVIKTIKNRKFESREELLVLYTYLYVLTFESTNVNISSTLSKKTGYSDSYIKTLNKEINLKYLTNSSKGISGGIFTNKTLKYINSQKFLQYL